MKTAPIKDDEVEDGRTDTMRERRCIVNGDLRPCDGMVRFVVGPGNEVFPDIEGKLPGRGLWVTAERMALTRAATGNVFAKAAKMPVKITDGLVDRVERLLVARLCGDLGLARRAGLLVCGFDNVLKSLDDKAAPRVLVEASDGAADGRGKIAGAAAARALGVTTVNCLSSTELSLALGRENVIHAAVKPGPLADRLIRDGARLAGMRTATMDAAAGPNPAG